MKAKEQVKEKVVYVAIMKKGFDAANEVAVVAERKAGLSRVTGISESSLKGRDFSQWQFIKGWAICEARMEKTRGRGKMYINFKKP